jgi:hypothetical protein
MGIIFPFFNFLMDMADMIFLNVVRRCAKKQRGAGHVNLARLIHISLIFLYCGLSHFYLPGTCHWCQTGLHT